MRFPKSSGSIKISVTCVPWIIVKILENRAIIFYFNISSLYLLHSSFIWNTNVKYQKINVGHEEELRCQCLIMNEKEYVIDNLKNVINKKKILNHARKLEGNQLERMI